MNDIDQKLREMISFDTNFGKNLHQMDITLYTPILTFHKKNYFLKNLILK